MAYDKVTLEKFDNCPEKVKATLESLMVHVQTAYCHSSLGAKIIIERVGDYIYLDKKLPICGLHKLKEDTANYLGDADLMVYMGAQQESKCSLVGLAGGLGTVCNPESKNRHCTNLFPMKAGLTNDAWVSNKIFT